MTKQEFINKEVALWDEDYIFDLLDRGYDVKLTSQGYKWFAPLLYDRVSQVDNCDLTRV